MEGFDLDEFQKYVHTKCEALGDVSNLGIYANYFHQHIFFQEVKSQYFSDTAPVRDSKVLAIFILIVAIFLGAGIVFFALVRGCLGRRSFHASVDSSETAGVATCNGSLERLRSYLLKYSKESSIVYMDVLAKKSNRFIEKGVTVRHIIDVISFREIFFALAISPIFYSYFYRNFRSVLLISAKYYVSYKFCCYSGIRLVQDAVNASLIHAYLQKYSVKNVVAGTTNERYGTYLQEICNVLSIDTVCIPHGVSPCLKLPNGIFGNSYMCLTSREREYLEAIYGPGRFIYDHQVINELYQRKEVFNSRFTESIVYATCSRDVKGDQRVMDKLIEYDFRFVIKLHPNDSLSNYRLPPARRKVVSIDEALCSTRLITKLSAITIDASENGSQVFVVIDSVCDLIDYRCLYFGAVHPSAKVVYSVDELVGFLGTDV
ncbi:MAG: hypothetical protein HWE12_15485 [Oceanospirillaceae bacterium]|nr:hypothetical protein [Oceanospirillaceae bacterium]